MPKRELRPSTVLKMQQLKHKDLQEKQASLIQTPQQSQQSSSLLSPMPPVLQQEEQPTHSSSQPEVHESIQESESTITTPQEVVREETPAQEMPEPMAEETSLPPPAPQQPAPQPEMKETPQSSPQQPPHQEQRWHPQMLMPEREAPTPAHSPHTTLDMTRIEDLTRHIMYRDPQKSAFARSKGR